MIPRKFTDEEVEEIKNLWKHGYAQSKIAKKKNCSQTVINYIVQNKTYKNQAINNTLPKNKVYKFSTNEVLEIRKLVAEGVSQVYFAKKYNVTQQTISNMIVRKTYKNI